MNSMNHFVPKAFQAPPFQVCSGTTLYLEDEVQEKDLSDPAADPTADSDEIRLELVERVRREIQEGTYDTPEKWEIALDRLADRLSGG
jgi:negative regulator of flagellin synthesis FlgM